MAQLDRSKPFAEVHGDDPRTTHRYEQGGKRFDHTGNEIGGKGQAPLKAVTKAEEPKKPDEGQLGSQLAEA